MMIGLRNVSLLSLLQRSLLLA